MAVISAPHALPRDIAYAIIFPLYLDLSIGARWLGAPIDLGVLFGKGISAYLKVFSCTAKIGIA